MGRPVISCVCQILYLSSGLAPKILNFTLPPFCVFFVYPINFTGGMFPVCAIYPINIKYIQSIFNILYFSKTRLNNYPQINFGGRYIGSAALFRTLTCRGSAFFYWQSSEPDEGEHAGSLRHLSNSD